jgi:hypothetical protein
VSRVHVLLRTPLFRGRYGAERKAELRVSAVELRGEATARDGGLDLLLSELRDEKGQVVDPLPFQRVFLPMSKIDFYVIEAG